MAKLWQYMFYLICATLAKVAVQLLQSYFLSNFIKRHICKIACVTGLKWNQTRLNFWRLFQKLFWRAPHFKSKNKPSFHEERRGAGPHRGARAKRGRALPPLFLPLMKWKFCFCFLNGSFENGVRAKKSFWNDFSKMECVWFHFKPMTMMNFAKMKLHHAKYKENFRPKDSFQQLKRFFTIFFNSTYSSP